VQKVLSSRAGVLGAWNDSDDDILRQEIKSEDTLLKRKRWNKIDSGFRLWGGGRTESKLNGESKAADVDDFLRSKGWNNVDSGFRFF
jgi:hypothetical protein